ncbi:MAG: fimbrillin family protein [Duncaniella sp.]|nr:fimbrillin family protein [Duncaniella sp.]
MNLKQAITYSIFVAAALTGLVMTSCDDRIDVPGAEGTDSSVKFGVSVAEPWSDGLGIASRNDDEVRIEPGVVSDNSLFLVTEVMSRNDSTATLSPHTAAAASRGTCITSVDGFWKGFGVTSILSTGDTYDADTDDGTGKRLTDNAKVSASGSDWVSPWGLTWTPRKETKFFAYAPYETENENLSYVTTGAPEVSYTVTTDIKKQIDLMYCATDPLTETKANGAVKLNFTHALSAVRIKTNEGMLAGDVKKITVSGVYGSGSSKIGSGTWETSGDKAEYTYEPDPELDIPAKGDDNYYAGSEQDILTGDLTLLMIPQELGEDATITFEFTDDFSGTHRALTAKIGGSGKEWEAGKLYTYSLSTSNEIFTPKFEVEINSYGAYNEKKTDADGNPTPMIPVSGILESVSAKAWFQTSALTDDGKVTTKNIKADWWLSYSTGEGGAEKAVFLTDDDADSTPDADADPVTAVRSGRLKIAAQPSWLKLPYTDETGSANDYYDLSGGTESSNCYVINNPGYYKLPLVYGNSLGHAEVLTGTDGIDGVWLHFKDQNNNDITSPWIKDNNGNIPHDCVLLWQDSPALITDVKIDGDYLTFRARPESFAQGNALVAVRNAEGVIMWSWHIWATKPEYYHTDYNADEGHKTNARFTDRPYEFGRANVGYCDPHDGNPERTVTLYANFRMPDNTVKAVKVGEYTQEALQESIAGDNTYYQWGRKDPMLGGTYGPGVSDHQSSHSLSNKDGTEGGVIADEFDMLNKRYYQSETPFIRTESRRTFAYTISHPNEFILGTYQVYTDDINSDPRPNTRQHWRDGGKVINAWDLNMTKEGSANKFPTESDTPVDPAHQLKSIYDPSPRGYRIPPVNAFSRMVLDEKNGSNNIPTNGNSIITHNSGNAVIGYSVGINEGGSEKIYFPLTGLRDMGPKREWQYDGSLNLLINDETYNKWNFTTGATDFDYTWAAHRKITFIATTTLSTNEQVLIFYLDNRNNAVYFNAGSNNPYGFTVRPVKGMSYGY